MADRTPSPRARRPQLPVHRFSYPQLLVVPVLLAAAFVGLAVTLALHDVNPGLLYSQCHARARVPWLSRAPVLGAPACFLVSFLSEAAASARSAASMASVLSLLGGLATVTAVEASRLCNASAPLIAHPTGPWLVFNLAGGQLVWSLVVVPAFLRRARRLAPLVDDPRLASDARDLSFAADVAAVPLAVALGFGAPSAALLATRGAPPAVLAWLLFPVSVAAVRRTARWALVRASPERAAPALRLEVSVPALAAVYGFPVLCSAAAHAWGLAALLAGPDDRREMTRSTLKFVSLDAVFVGLTVLYWVLAEGGWRPAALMVLVSFVLGPGAGVCAAWVCREWTAHAAGLGGGAASARDEESERIEADTAAGEDTPLLR
ncbi:hypothetical protein RB595_008738 [Gaeumannomyces hyphopodioides]